MNTHSVSCYIVIWYQIRCINRATIAGIPTPDHQGSELVDQSGERSGRDPYGGLPGTKHPDGTRDKH